MPILYYHINAASKNPFKIGLSTLVICNIQFLFEFLQYNASTEFTSAELSQKSFKTGFYCHIKNWNTTLFGFVFIRQYSFLIRKSLSQLDKITKTFLFEIAPWDCSNIKKRRSYGRTWIPRVLWTRPRT